MAQLAMTTLESRVAFLEQKEKINCSELKRMDDDIVKLTVENAVLKEMVVELKKSTFKNCETRTSPPEGITRVCERLTNKMTELTTKVNLQTLQFQKRWATFTEECEKVKSLQRIFNKVLVESSKPKTNPLVQQLQNSVQQIKKEKDEQTACKVFARVKPSKNLQFGSTTKLDVCESIIDNSRHFDPLGCVYTTPCDGMYGVEGALNLNGVGSIGLKLVIELVACKTNNNTINKMSIHLGKIDTCGRFFNMIKLAKGDKFWLEAILEEGSPQIQVATIKSILLCSV